MAGCGAGGEGRKYMGTLYFQFNLAGNIKVL